MDNSDPTDADVAAVPWLNLGAMGGYSHASVPQSIREELISARTHLFTPCSELPNFNAANDTFMPALTTSIGTFTNLTTQPNHKYLDVPDAWSMLAPHTSNSCFCHGPSCSTDAKALLDASSVAPHRTEISLFPAHSLGTAPYVVSPSSSATPPAFQDEWAWLFETGHSTHATPSSLSSSSDEEGLVAPEYGPRFYGVTSSIGACGSPAEWGIGDLSWPIPAVPATSVPTLALGKRRRDKSHGDGAPVVIDSYEMLPQKRGRGGKRNGVFKTARSVARTRHKPVARTPKQDEWEPKQVGRGAERLATPNAQGIHHPSLLGPSFQQGWAVDAGNRKLTWVEGSAGEKAMRDIDSTQQQQEEAKVEDFKIPKIFKVGYKALLAATQDEWARGAIRKIKCRLCPDTNLKTWEDFKRHCDTMEAHPLKISFCDNCGNFFARGDSLERHLKNRPPECRSVTPEKADAKRRETEKAHDEFRARLEGFLRTGEDIGRPFWQIIKEKFPESSKKYRRGGREQSQLTGR